jgi:FAD-dependent urate hydroxylase
MKVIIIGAGIGGLCAAIALRRAGIDVTVYERAPVLGEVGAGLTLWANAVKALKKLGIGEQVLAASLFQGDGGFHDLRGRRLQTTSAAAMEQRFGAPTIAVHRAGLQKVLLDAAGDLVQTGKVFRTYSQHQQGVTAHFADGTTAQGDMLIGADGLRSAVRGQMQPDSPPRYRGYTAWRSVILFDYEQINGLWGESLGYGQRFGIVPIGGGQVYWFATHNAPAGTKIGKSELQRLFAGWHKPARDLIDATPEDLLLQHDLYDLDPLKYWVDRQVALLGDAAHGMTPNMGQGACQAIEDAVILGDSLAGAVTPEAGLQAYQTQRIKRANGILMRSRRIGEVMQIGNPVVCALRDFVLRATPKAMLMEQLAGVAGYSV